MTFQSPFQPLPKSLPNPFQSPFQPLGEYIPIPLWGWNPRLGRGSPQPKGPHDADRTHPILATSRLSGRYRGTPAHAHALRAWRYDDDGLGGCGRDRGTRGSGYPSPDSDRHHGVRVECRYPPVCRTCRHGRDRDCLHPGRGRHRDAPRLSSCRAHKDRLSGRRSGTLRSWCCSPWPC